MLWTFHLVVLLIFLYLLQFFFHQLCHVDCQKNESCSTNQKELFFYLLFFLVFLYFQSDLDLRETEFHLTIFMLASSSLLIYLCFFVHETSLELLITSFSYLFLNILIGAVIADIEVFFRCTMLYVTIQSLIGMILYLVSLLTNESLTCIFNKVKLKIFISKLVFLSMTLNSINFHYFLVSLWLQTFTFQLIVLNIYSFLITKNPGLQTLERKPPFFQGLYSIVVPLSFLL